MKGIMILFDILMIIVQIIFFIALIFNIIFEDIERFKKARTNMKIQVTMIFISWAYVIIKFAVNLF